MNHASHGVRHASDERSPLLVPGAPPELATETTSSEQNCSKPKQEPNISPVKATFIVLSLGCLILMQTANISLLTTIQSSVADDLHVYTAVSWFASAYLIAMSSTPAIAGTLSQMFGPHNYILGSSMIFAVGIIVTATASNLPHFLTGRAIAGLGASANYPIGIIIIIETTSPQRRGLFIGLMNSAFTFGLALGAVLSGALDPLLGWRGIFWIQVPIVLGAGLGLFALMPRRVTPASDGMGQRSFFDTLVKIDYLGIITMLTSIVSLLVGLSSAQILIVPIIFSAIMFSVFILIETKYAIVPIIPYEVLRSRGTILSCIASLIIIMARYTIILYTPMFFMTVHSWGPARSGTILLALNGGFAVGGVFVGWIHIRRAGSFYSSSLAMFILYGICTGTLAGILNRSTPVWLYTILGFINGLIAGASLNYTFAHLLHLTPPSTHFIGGSVVAMFRGFGGSFSSAIMGGIFVRVLKGALEAGFASYGLEGEEDLIRELLGKPRLVAELVGAEKDVAIGGYVAAIRAVLATSAIMALVGGGLAQAGTGWKEEWQKRDDYDHDSEE